LKTRETVMFDYYELSELKGVDGDDLAAALVGFMKDIS